MAASSAAASPVSTGNRVAQFIFLTAMFCVFYQLVLDDSSSSLPSSPSFGAASSSPTSSASGPAPSPFLGRAHDDEGPAPATYQREDTRHMTASECTCFLACLGLFGLLRHNKRKSELEKQQREEEEEDEALQRTLLLSRKVIVRQRGRRDTGADSERKRPTPHSKDLLPLASAWSAELATTKDVAVSNVAASSPVSEKRTVHTLVNLPDDVVVQILLFLTPRELATRCPLVCRSWDRATSDSADSLWRLVFLRNFGERGDRFHAVFPIDSWRQFYFRHRVSRAVELARLLDLTEKRKCVVIENQVYDVTAFIDSHPGGAHVIGDAVGTDATDLWEQFQHSTEAKDMMKDFLVFDRVLASPEQMRGTLQQTATQWRRLSWCLAQSHCFGSMSGAFESVMLRFHSRPRRRRP